MKFSLSNCKFILLALFLFSSSAFALDRIEMKNGETLDGNIVEQSEQNIYFDGPHGLSYIPTVNIARVNGMPISGPPPAPRKPQPVK